MKIKKLLLIIGTICIAVSLNLRYCRPKQTPTVWLKADKTSCIIELSDSFPDTYDFVFSTAKGKMFIMADGATAQVINDTFMAQKKFSLYDLGAANAFFIKSSIGPMLCTASHAATGLEDYSVQMGADITFIDYELLPNRHQISNFVPDSSAGYELQVGFQDFDSLIVKGYLPTRDGKIHYATVRGVAVKQLKSEVPEESSEYHYVGKEGMQKTMLLMKMDQPFDLGGLSGSPAFNADNKVVGIYSGRIRMVTNQDTVYYIRVSMMDKE